MMRVFCWWQRKRWLGGAGSAGQALPSGHGNGLLAEGPALQEGSRSGL